MTLDIRKLLVLSTGHVTNPATREALSRQVHPDYPVVGGPVTHGWLAYAHDDQSAGSDRIPDDLWACMVFARLHGCDYLLFDCDAQQADGLPYVEF